MHYSNGSHNFMKQIDGRLDLKQDDGVNSPFYAQPERNHEDQLSLEADIYFELTARGFTSEHARHHAAEVVELIGGLKN